MLTATMTLNGVTTRREFQVTVPARLPFNRVAQFSFENSLNEQLGRFTTATATGNRIFDLGSVSFAPGEQGQAVSLDGAFGVRPPDGLIDDHSYSIALWLQPTAVSQFTSALFGWASGTSWISECFKHQRRQRQWRRRCFVIGGARARCRGDERHELAPSHI